VSPKTKRNQVDILIGVLALVTRFFYTTCNTIAKSGHERN